MSLDIQTSENTRHGFRPLVTEARPGAEAQRRAAALANEWELLPADEILRRAMEHEFAGEIALVSSFGAESAALLHLASVIDPAIPVIFLDTERHFFQTLQYRDELKAHLGLRNLIVVKPDKVEIAAGDPEGMLSRSDPDKCCNLRKVRPNQLALAPYGAWISGRKRFQGGLRARLPVVEHDGRHFKINPLATWTAEDVAAYMRRNDLPAHRLLAEGYPSIGCWPCTRPVETGTAQGARAGRWADGGKTECGIHTDYDPGI